MRKELGLQNGIRKKFSGTFDRIGKKINYKGYSEETVLLKNIIDVAANTRVADHLWFKLTKGFEKLVLTQGATVEFEARVTPYTKGYVNKKYNMNARSMDYKLSHPTKIRLVYYGRA